MHVLKARQHVAVGEPQKRMRMTIPTHVGERRRHLRVQLVAQVENEGTACKMVIREKQPTALVEFTRRQAGGGS
jgi:hypothetical protein